MTRGGQFVRDGRGRDPTSKHPRRTHPAGRDSKERKGLPEALPSRACSPTICHHPPLPPGPLVDGSAPADPVRDRPRHPEGTAGAQGRHLAQAGRTQPVPMSIGCRAPPLPLSTSDLGLPDPKARRKGGPGPSPASPTVSCSHGRGLRAAGGQGTGAGDRPPAAPPPTPHLCHPPPSCPRSCGPLTPWQGQSPTALAELDTWPLSSSPPQGLPRHPVPRSGLSDVLPGGSHVYTCHVLSSAAACHLETPELPLAPWPRWPPVCSRSTHPGSTAVCLPLPTRPRASGTEFAPTTGPANTCSTLGASTWPLLRQRLPLKPRTRVLPTPRPRPQRGLPRGFAAFMLPPEDPPERYPNVPRSSQRPPPPPTMRRPPPGGRGIGTGASAEARDAPHSQPQDSPSPHPTRTQHGLHKEQVLTAQTGHLRGTRSRHLLPDRTPAASSSAGFLAIN